MKIKDGHTDVASMRRLCKTIIEDCKEISGALPEQEAALPTWLTNKIAVSGAYLNSARDYLMYYVAEGNDDEGMDVSDTTVDNPGKPESEFGISGLSIGEADATEKGKEPEDDIEEHQGVDEETFTFEIKSDSYHLEETGDIEEGSPTQTSGSYSFDFSGESSSETEEIKF